MLAAGFHLIDLFHPLRYWGYQFWSGIGSDFGEITTPASVSAAVMVYVRGHNCHVHRCPRMQWHPHPDHGHPVCRKHHPHDPRSLSDSQWG